jgi:hypothetical protein
LYFFLLGTKSVRFQGKYDQLLSEQRRVIETLVRRVATEAKAPPKVDGNSEPEVG